MPSKIVAKKKLNKAERERLDAEIRDILSRMIAREGRRIKLEAAHK